MEVRLYICFKQTEYLMMWICLFQESCKFVVCVCVGGGGGGGGEAN